MPLPTSTPRVALVPANPPAVMSAAFGQCGCRITSLASMEVWALNSALCATTASGFSSVPALSQDEAMRGLARAGGERDGFIRSQTGGYASSST